MKIHLLALLIAAFPLPACKKQTGAHQPTFAINGARFSERGFDPKETLVKGDLAYSAKLILSSDGGVVGVTLDLFNLSRVNPLKMRSAPDCIPMGVALQGPNGELLFSAAEVLIYGDIPPLTMNRPENKRDIEWQIAPSSAKRYYIPIRLLAKDLLLPERIGPCYLTVSLSTIPESIPDVLLDSRLSPFQFAYVYLTREALEIDPEQALKEALAASGDVDASNYIRPVIPKQNDPSRDRH